MKEAVKKNSAERTEMNRNGRIVLRPRVSWKVQLNNKTGSITRAVKARKRLNGRIGS
jgi:hypothetical protein